jgi:hypothetical protein
LSRLLCTVELSKVPEQPSHNLRKLVRALINWQTIRITVMLWQQLNYSKILLSRKNCKDFIGWKSKRIAQNYWILCRITTKTGIYYIHNEKI